MNHKEIMALLLIAVLAVGASVIGSLAQGHLTKKFEQSGAWRNTVGKVL